MLTVVTGCARTGTSLAMQLLRALGLTVVGDAFPDHCGASAFNRNGYWELPAEYFETPGALETFGSCVVKIWPRYLINIPPRLVGRGIICTRAPHATVESMMKLARTSAQYAGTTDEALRSALFLHYQKTYADAGYYLNSNSIPTITIPFERIVARPMDVLPRLCDFAGGCKEKILAATKIIELPMVPVKMVLVQGGMAPNPGEN